jgi:hypothetical protein
VSFPTTEQELSGLIQRELNRSRLPILVRQLQERVPLVGEGSPEGVLVAPLSSLYQDTLNGELWVKESEPTPDTGWVMK